MSPLLTPFGLAGEEFSVVFPNFDIYPRLYDSVLRQGAMAGNAPAR